MIIGITGSIGSGKTTIAKIFSKHHFTRIDADEIGHEIIKKNSAAYKKILREFGNEILDKNKNIDRKKLGDIVFSNKKKLSLLNSITHPVIIIEIKKRIKKIKNECGNEAKIIIDAPLLLETGAHRLVDKVIVVKTFSENIIARNKQFSVEQLEKISMTQMPLDQKLKYAGYMIDNNGNLKNLKKQVKEIANMLNQ